MKMFCESLRDHAVNIVSFENEKIKLLTKEQQKSYGSAKICYIYKGKFEDKYDKDKKYRNLETIVIMQVNAEVLNIAYVT